MLILGHALILGFDHVLRFRNHIADSVICLNDNLSLTAALCIQRILRRHGQICV